MSNSALKLTPCRALRIGMNPLLIKGSIGEGVDLLLRNFNVRGNAEFFTDVSFKFRKTADDEFAHVYKSSKDFELSK